MVGWCSMGTFNDPCTSAVGGELKNHGLSQVWRQDSSQHARRTTRVCGWPSIQTLGTQLRLWRAKWGAACPENSRMENSKHGMRWWMMMIFLEFLRYIPRYFRYSQIFPDILLRHRWKWMFLKFDLVAGNTTGEVWRSCGQLRNNHPQSWPPASWRTKCHHGPKTWFIWNGNGSGTWLIDILE